MVPESESAQVSIAVFGFPDGIDPFSFRSPLEAFILLYTSDGSAIGRYCYYYYRVKGSLEGIESGPVPAAPNLFGVMFFLKL